MLSFKKSTSIYDKLVVKDDELNLKEIIERTKKDLPIWESENNVDDEMTMHIKYSTEGDIRHKEVVRKKIIAYLISEYKNISPDNIDSVINQYHVNYYSNLFSKDEPIDEIEKNIYEYFDRFILYKDDTIEKKYLRLSQIIYQESYGLSVIDELAEDTNHINGLWTNGIDDIRIQFRGVKRRVSGLRFQSENTYKQVISNSISYDATQDIGADNPTALCSRRNGSRITAIFPPIYKTPYLNVRNFNDNIVSKQDILREKTHNEAIITFNECVTKGLPNFSIIGPMGAGKTTYLRMLIGEYDKNLGVLVIQPTDELRLEKYYKDMDIRTHIYSKQHPPSELLELSFREDRDIIFQGEIRTPDEAYLDIYVKQRVARGSGDTYHARDFTEFITTRRNLLMQTKLYQNHHIAEKDIADSNDLVYQLMNDTKTGRRYVNKISEVEKDKDTFKERIIFEYDKKTDDWIVRNDISDKLYKKLSQEHRFDEEVKNTLKTVLNSESKVV